ncbi:LOW QUALITY PROTEIN: uncharacterized protein LOC116928256 [Daphnia magna]|uniref:LOW QUALITY PROTEIN: uncharacterized protein LOC116928256 n=1 Tax=Daphnia magna TaxID=35525 RepID=UPI001E1BBC4E|nr:LOW QUALITY PROTEIN: uncharacterized protein LOC116928256 [Daphnia magna]
MGFRRFKTQKWLWIFALLFFVLLYLLAISLPNVNSEKSNHFSDSCECSPTTGKHQLPAENAENEISDHHNNNRLAVIVPFRDRFQELIEFVPHMHKFLSNQSVLHDIFIINQSDNFRFNRASLINVGFVHISLLEKFDYIAMHDVDLLPVNPQLKYVNPGDGFALHIASPKLHPKYHYETFVGGILILTIGDFKKLNGLSNKYWGWGLEDDEFFHRMKQSGIKVLRPDNVMDYSELTERLRKTLYYGSVSKASHSLNSSLPLTRVMVEKFSETDSNLFLEKLCFEYAAELSREACLSPCSLVVALIYLERLCQSNPNFVSSIPSSKLFLVSVMVASKFLNDEGEEDEVINSEWANSAKIDLSNLNQIERQFLQAIEWRLFVDDQDFAETLARIEFRVAQRESLKRGWLTYTDLDILARQKLLSDTWNVVYDLVINVSVACMTAYLASLVTLVGSAIVVSSLPWNSGSSPSSPTFTQSTSLNPPYGTKSVNASSDLQPEIDLIDSESNLVDSAISEFAFQYPDLDSDTFLKDFTAVALGSYSHLPKPPFLMFNETSISVSVKNFTSPFLYLQHSFCALVSSTIGYHSDLYALSPLCLTLAS